MITLPSLLFAMTLDADVKRLASTIDATVGVAAIELDVVKLPLAVTLLRRVDSAGLKLDQTYTLTERDFSPGHSPIRDRAEGKPVTDSVLDTRRNCARSTPPIRATRRPRWRWPASFGRSTNGPTV